MTKYQVVRAYTIYVATQVESTSRNDADEQGSTIIDDSISALSLPNCEVFEYNLEDYQECEEV